MMPKLSNEDQSELIKLFKTELIPDLEILLRKFLFLKSPHWINKEPNKNDQIKILSRIRQVGELLPSKLLHDKSKKSFKIILNKAITGVSEGQAIVLYQGKKALGGGVISF